MFRFLACLAVVNAVSSPMPKPDPVHPSIRWRCTLVHPGPQAVLQTPATNSVMKLRGGMSLGPLNPNNFNGACQVAAAVTAAAAITEKYGGLGENALTKKFKGDWQNTNLIIALVTGGASTVVASVNAAAGFETAKVGAVLWLVSVLSKAKDAGDASSITANKEETLIAAAATYLAFA